MRYGEINTRPSIDKKLSWKLVSQRTRGSIATMTAPANDMAATALRCLPRSSATRNTLPMIVARTTVGGNPVSIV